MLSTPAFYAVGCEGPLRRARIFAQKLCAQNSLKPLQGLGAFHFGQDSKLQCCEPLGEHRTICLMNLQSLVLLCRTIVGVGKRVHLCTSQPAQASRRSLWAADASRASSVGTPNPGSPVHPIAPRTWRRSSFRAAAGGRPAAGWRRLVAVRHGALQRLVPARQAGEMEHSMHVMPLRGLHVQEMPQPPTMRLPC